MSPHPDTRTPDSGHAARPQRPGPRRPPQPRDGDTRHTYNHCTSAANVCQRRQRWRRPMKAILLLLAIVCAGLMSSFAYAHSREIHRDKWAKLSSIAPISAKTFELPMPANPPALLFLIASMSFTASAYTYHSVNRSDSFQNPILILGTVLGLLMALSIDLGILLGIFGLEHWFFTSESCDQRHIPFSLCSKAAVRGMRKYPGIWRREGMTLRKELLVLVNSAFDWLRWPSTIEPSPAVLWGVCWMFFEPRLNRPRAFKPSLTVLWGVCWMFFGPRESSANKLRNSRLNIG